MTVLPKGTEVGGYVIEGLVCHGSAACVYEATQLSLERTVALKVLSDDFSEDPLFRERFRREGILQARFDHPHIVTVYEAGEAEQGLFMAMCLIRGPTLKDLIVDEALDPQRALRILAAIADALDAAHDIGLIHRDVKPQNILISDGDRARLADFGLTKAPAEVSLTGSGQFIGTIDYVSPEQVHGEDATPQSDLYSLATVLYECLTGEVPFPRNSDAAVLYAHASDPPPRPSERRADLPVAVDDVIARGMSKLPEDRYPTAAEMIRSAESALRLGKPAASVDSRPSGP